MERDELIREVDVLKKDNANLIKEFDSYNQVYGSFQLLLF